MNALIRKEIRLVFPAWLTALLLAIVPAVFFETPDEMLLGGSVLLVGGLIILALASFGREFSHSTFSILLAQPISRKRLWLIKFFVLVAGVFLIYLAFCIVCGIRLHQALEIPLWKVNPKLLREDFWMAIWMAIGWGSLAALVVTAGGLWTTLLFRQIAAAFWFVVLVPFFLLLILSWILPATSIHVGYVALISTMVVYSIFGIWWSRRMLLHAQDIQLSGGVLDWNRTKTGDQSSARNRKPLRELVAKEFQSHRVSFLISGILLGLHFAVLGLRKLEHDPAHNNSTFYTLLNFYWLLWFILPALIGATTVAEERQQGTLESFLCLPTSRFRKWAAKLIIALGLGIFFGGILPWCVERIGLSIGVSNPAFVWNKTESTSYLTAFASLCGAAFGVALVSSFASTLTRNVLHALSAAVVIGIVLSWFGEWSHREAYNMYASHGLWHGSLGAYVGLPVIVVVLLWLSYVNFQRVQIGRNFWIGNATAISFALAFIVGATAFIWNREWERFMVLEPKHSAAVLSGPVQPMVCFGIFKPFVLLPDGRLWNATQFKTLQRNEYEYINGERRLTKYKIPLPVSGEFLKETNWVGLANIWREVVGLRSDGTLWKIFEARGTNYSANPGLERIGLDTNWKKIVSGGGFFLALKTDGTIWGWGDNWSGQLGSGPARFINGPVRVGNDSDWVDVFTSGRETSIGIKEDGSVWKWGAIYNAPSGHEQNWNTKHPEPVQWNINGSNFVAFAGNSQMDMALERDGTLFIDGIVPEWILKKGRPHVRAASNLKDSNNSLRVTINSDWSDITMDWSLLFGLKKDGSLVEGNVNMSNFPLRGNTWKPSRYSDWIGISSSARGQSIALAADGTLCSWEDPEDQIRQKSILGPTRKPLWSLNILAKKKIDFQISRNDSTSFR